MFHISIGNTHTTLGTRTTFTFIGDEEACGTSTPGTGATATINMTGRSITRPTVTCFGSLSARTGISTTGSSNTTISPTTRSRRIASHTIGASSTSTVTSLRCRM